MITSFKQYKYYVEQDEQANGGKHRFLYIDDEIKKYLKIMRCREFVYYLNKKQPNNIAYKIYNHYLNYRLHRLGLKLGFGIPINCTGPGLRIDHYGFIAINSNAKIGKNCHIYGDITVGVKDPDNSVSAPIIGDNVVIGTGARIIGSVKIASNCIIGANAVVTHDFLKEGKNIAGVPAKVIN